MIFKEGSKMKNLNESERKVFVCNVQILLKSMNVTVDILAASIYESRSSVYRMFNGEKTLSEEKAKLIADFFHKDFEELKDPQVAYISLYKYKEIITKNDFSLAKKVVITYLKGLDMEEWVKETSDFQELMIRTAAETKKN